MGSPKGHKWLIHDPALHAAGHFEEFYCLYNPIFAEAAQGAEEYARQLCEADWTKCARFFKGVRLQVKALGLSCQTVLLRCRPQFFESYADIEDEAERAGRLPYQAE